MRYGALGALLSLALGVGATGYLMDNYRTPAQPTQYVTTVGDEATTESPTPTPTPTESVSPTSSPGVEGDDGSLGGPVLDESHQATPTYVINTPEETPVVTSTTTPEPTPTQEWPSDDPGNGNWERSKDPSSGLEIVKPAPASPREVPSDTESPAG